MYRFLLLVLALLLLGGCSSAPQLSRQDLMHHHWVLDKLDDQPITVPARNRPDLEIGEHFTVNGIAGCNRYFGQGRLKGDRLKVNNLGSTSMACLAPLDTIEQAVLDTLQQGATLEGDTQRLILQGKRHRLEYKLLDWVY
ncbi:MAG: META domain-containing protein [Aeromonas molluscorum]